MYITWKLFMGCVWLAVICAVVALAASILAIIVVIVAVAFVVAAIGFAITQVCYIIEKREENARLAQAISDRETHLKGSIES